VLRGVRASLPGGASLRSLLKAFDSGVGFGMLAPLASMAAGPVILLAVASSLTQVAQGFFYTFTSLIAFQLLFDMGSAQVLLQFASHEWSELRQEESGCISGSPVALAKLRSLLLFAAGWALVVSTVAGFVLGFSGGSLFAGSKETAGINWSCPWAALCTFTALNMLLTPIWAILEGCNRITRVYAYRFCANLAQNLAICVALFLGRALWSVAIGAGVSFSVSVGMLAFGNGGFLAEIWRAQPVAAISWRREIFPLQWRFALSWWSGCLLSYSFTPILFHFRGADLAGKMGMSWTVIATIGAVAYAWVSTKAARFGVLIARRQYDELDRLAVHSGIASLAVMVVCASGFEAALVLLRRFGFPVAFRLLPPLPLGVFLAGHTLMQIPVIQSVYLRAHKREPFVWLSAAAAVLMMLLGFYLVGSYGVLGLAAGYCTVMLCYIPAGTLILIRFRRQWQGHP
jgi:hypothetical protein